jgi:hypothetical protein
MSTEFKNTQGQVVAVRSWGGVERGTVVEFEKEWTGVGFVCDESGAWVHCSTVVGSNEVVVWDCWRARRRAADFERVARRWEEHPEVAEGCNRAADEVRNKF